MSESDHKHLSLVEKVFFWRGSKGLDQDRGLLGCGFKIPTKYRKKYQLYKCSCGRKIGDRRIVQQIFKKSDAPRGETNKLA
jgi:hypothetical protein